jgi:hypothetical protein
MDAEQYFIIACRQQSSSKVFDGQEEKTACVTLEEEEWLGPTTSTTLHIIKDAPTLH